MTSVYVSLKDDVNRLTAILSEITDTDVVYIYPDTDKRKPQNAITYYHLDAVPQLEKAGQLKILDNDRNVDERAPNHVAPLYYQVKILVRDQAKKLELWPINFKWIDKTTFRAGEFDEVTFSSGSNRLKIFQILTEKKFGWAEVREIHNRTGISEADIRTTLNQIDERLKQMDNVTERRLAIVPRKNVPSAYRLTVVSKQKTSENQQPQ